MAGSVHFRAVGDIGPNRPEPGDCFALAREKLLEADLAFCQLECVIGEIGARLPQVRHTHRAVESSPRAIREAGFDVVSFASNHCMDWGAEAFHHTIEQLRREGLAVVGVGENLVAAIRPEIREVNGVRIAFLAACSILPKDFWAQADRPGCVPMRAHTVYEQIEPDQPGTPARIHTFAFGEDLQALAEAVKRARAEVDAVIVSLHWGIHFVPAVIADYQREVARVLAEAGATMILGHHAHILKGVEFFGATPVFYSIGNFAIDLPMDPAHAQSKGFKEIQALSPGWEPDFDSLYNFPPDSRMTMIVDARISKDGLSSLGFIPAFINRDAQPEPIEQGDDRFDQILAYMRWCNEHAGFPTGLEVRKGRVEVLPAAG